MSATSLCRDHPFGLAIAAALHGWSPVRRGHGVRGLPGPRGPRRSMCHRARSRWRRSRCRSSSRNARNRVALRPVSPLVRKPQSPDPLPAIRKSRPRGAEWDFWYDFALRDILDPIVGWIPFAPVHWLGFAALGSSSSGSAGPRRGSSRRPPSMSSRGERWARLGLRHPRQVLDDRHSADRRPTGGGDPEAPSRSRDLLPLLAVSIVFTVAAVATIARCTPPSSADLRSSEHASAFPNLNEYQWAVGFTLAPGRWEPQTGTVNGARSSQGPAGTRPDTSCTGRTAS